ncbi:DUF3472 domain-containing protein [Caballeronia sp. LZ035]|uniref:DUF3472 domain-containing protein n=1 Tax=Caballeronia sp. LZ035 TaxID=3038568 RepID=UPI002862C1E9|nr:hypothetical protein [Caballeronia sp. LZ035]MDR5757284.1 hypothetical protein [Caballeronia sp. LZ035]
MSNLKFKKKCCTATLALALVAGGVVPSALAITPSGGWTLAAASPDVRDYFLRVDIDPGEKYVQPGYAPSSVYWAQYVNFDRYSGYLGLQRTDGTKLAIVSIWSGAGATGNTLPAVSCNEGGPCSSIKGPYDWKVGHQYRFRVERSPRHADNEWQITLADLTTGTEDILGEIQLPDDSGLKTDNGLFLEYFWGPYECQTLRAANATYAPPRGDFGRATALAAMNGTAYGDPDVCNSPYPLSGMTPAEYGSSSSVNSTGVVTATGNAYRGVQQYGKYNSTARAGMMFATDPAADRPQVYRALKDGTYGSFPTTGKANAYWQPLGRGTPVINDLYFRNQPLRQWEERGASYVSVGDFFVYENPYTGDTEYFKLKRTSAGYFPVDKTSNDDWTYVGRHPRKDEPIPPMVVHQWGENNRVGRLGSVFQDGTLYFRLKTGAPSQYWYFPTTPTDNNDWEFLGYHA